MKKNSTQIHKQILVYVLILLFSFSAILYAGDKAAPKQTAGKHSTISTEDGKIRDDELAEHVAENIPKDEDGNPLVKDVKIFFQQCFGGGCLEEFEEEFGEGGEAEGTKWVGGSASDKDEKSWGHESKADPTKSGDNWTEGATDEDNGGIQNGGKVTDTLDNAEKNDTKAKDGSEDPQTAHGNGGEDIEWSGDGDTKHRAVLVGGKNEQRHNNDIDDMEEALEDAWEGEESEITTVKGGTTQEILDAIKDACEDLDPNTQLVIYITDHGSWTIDMNEYMDWAEWMAEHGTAVPIPFIINPGWQQALDQMYIQGQTPSPSLEINLENTIDTNDWLITLNGSEVPLPEGTMGPNTYELPVDWRTIKAGTNYLEITRLKPYGSMMLSNWSIHGGPIDQALATTENCETIDDFDLYPDTGRLHNNWMESAGTATYVSIDSNNAFKNQSMEMVFDDSSPPYYSEVERNFEQAQDWSSDEPRALHFYIQKDEMSPPIADIKYVEISDANGQTAFVSYNELIDEPELLAYIIPMEEFAVGGVDLSQVTRIALGFGDKQGGAPGGSGVVYFDYIRVCPPACSGKSVGDIDGDCDVDFSDFGHFANEWLSSYEPWSETTE